MDELPENRQQEEITALKSIYGDDFIECPPPKAWKVRPRPCAPRRASSDVAAQGAPRLPEFIIRVRHPDPDSASKIYLHLHVKFVLLF
jgi:eukaryotic translation initiation factor 2-alpha kinase 4